MRIGLLFISSILLFSSCNLLPGIGYKYNSGTISEKPVNFEFLNSEYDDYNSTSPILGETFPICFSSNRDSQGGQFDIIYKLVKFHFSKSTGDFTVEEETNGNLDVVTRNQDIRNAIRKANSDFDEYGPYLTRRFDYDTKSRILLFANNESGNFDIKFTHNLNDEQKYETTANISYLNSSFDDYYPTFNRDSTSIYWCSNRSGNFDIHQVKLNGSLPLLERLFDQVNKEVKDIEVLNSASNDKCPFIIDDKLVFASDRAGGFGGFDLYYSVLVNGEWSKPQNFGPKINSEADEYRPIIRPQQNELTNDLMIFSSNREGGLGGFDLYYVGIDKEL